MALVSHFWSGKHHRVVKGLNLVTLFYTDPQGRSVPLNYRVYDKSEGKTKNDYFVEMLREVLDWGLRPSFTTGDSWYSCVSNLKAIKNHRMSFVFAVESNRLVSKEKGTWTQVHKLDIPDEGMNVWLRDFGQVKLFRTRLKDQLRHYIVYLVETPCLDSFGRADFKRLHDLHWQIEQYHRVIKQVCNIERFQVRGKVSILNHIFCALCGYVYLQKMQMNQLITNAYQMRSDLYKDVVGAFVRSFIVDKDHLNPQFRPTVNA